MLSSCLSFAERQTGSKTDLLYNESPYLVGPLQYLGPEDCVRRESSWLFCAEKQTESKQQSFIIALLCPNNSRDHYPHYCVGPLACLGPGHCVLLHLLCHLVHKSRQGTRQQSFIIALLTQHWAEISTHFIGWGLYRFGPWRLFDGVFLAVF